jgi:hypothetical protein
LHQGGAARRGADGWLRDRRVRIGFFRRAGLGDRFVEIRHRTFADKLAANIDRLTEAQDAKERLRYRERREFGDAAHQERTADRQAEDAALIAVDVELATVVGDDVMPARFVDCGPAGPRQPALADKPQAVLRTEAIFLVM